MKTLTSIHYTEIRALERAIATCAALFAGRHPGAPLNLGEAAALNRWEEALKALDSADDADPRPTFPPMPETEPELPSDSGPASGTDLEEERAYAADLAFDKARDDDLAGAFEDEYSYQDSCEVLPPVLRPDLAKTFPRGER